MRVLVVDDEPPARRRLQRLLEEIGDVEVVGEASTGAEGLEKVRALQPDVMLLDIRMPGMDGLTLAASGADLPPIVFVTAYDEHAVAAFEANAVDYLLKPVRRERLQKALGRVRARSTETQTDLQRLMELLAAQQEVPRVTAQESGTLHVFDAREITRFYASDKYTAFCVEGREFLIEESLSQLEERLHTLDFMRVHRGELIGLRHVRAVRSEDAGGVAELTDGQCARVSRRHLPALRRALVKG
ncbi:MAG: LytTR family DNA-binding domain-containing protein [Myxococcota bacterium]